MHLELTSNLFLTIFLSPLTHGLAYLDPGSGSFILQILAASLLGALFLVKTYWQKITAFFRGNPSEDTSQTASPEDDDLAE
jgi:hypothetical protein